MSGDCNTLLCFRLKASYSSDENRWILKEQENVDIVIDVTHMRLEQDTLASEGCPLIDLKLGGHDREIVVQGDKVGSWYKYYTSLNCMHRVQYTIDTKATKEQFTG